MSTVNFKGAPVNLAGEFITAGETAPDFRLSKSNLSTLSLSELWGKYVLLNIFPSLDTAVCATTVRKFNTLATRNPDTVVLAISKDLPFAQARFCSTEGIDRVTALSDFRVDSEFGTDYGVLMTDGPLNGLFARAIVVIDPMGKVVYTELVPDVTGEPDYERALKACHARA